MLLYIFVFLSILLSPIHCNNGRGSPEEKGKPPSNIKTTTTQTSSSVITPAPPASPPTTLAPPKLTPTPKPPLPQDLNPRCNIPTVPRNLKSIQSTSLGTEDFTLQIYNAENQVTDISQYPFIVHLLLEFVELADYDGLCGGSIIGDRWVLTAAHCLCYPGFTLVEVTIYAGTAVLLTNAIQTFVVKPDNCTCHPNFLKNDTIVINDMGLIYIGSNNKFDFTNPNIQPIPYACCTPLGGGLVSNVLGWGITTNGGYPSSQLLISKQLGTLNNSDCNQIYWKGMIGKGHTCAKAYSTNASNPCNGDSGGPLFTTCQGQKLLIGMVSYGSTNCSSARPCVYTRVSSFSSFIELITGIACTPILNDNV